MYLSEFKSAVKDWLGDPPREVIDDLRIQFFVLSAFDNFAGQMVNARKIQSEYKQTVTPTGLETTFTLTLATKQASYARRRVMDTTTQDIWEDVDVAENIETLNEAANEGRYAILITTTGSTNALHLSWEPADDETIELWGQFNPFGASFKAKLIDAPSFDPDVTEIPDIFNHLVIENAALRAIAYLFKDKTLREFATAQRDTLTLSYAKREIIWNNWLAGSPDDKRRHQVRAYSPFDDPIFAEHF